MSNSDQSLSKLAMYYFSTYIYGHSARAWADVGAGKREWFSTHLAKASHKGMVWDTYAYELRGNSNSNNRRSLINHLFAVLFSNIQLKGNGLTEVKGLSSVFSTSDLSNTRVTGPGSRSPNSASFTFTLQYLSMETKTIAKWSPLY